MPQYARPSSVISAVGWTGDHTAIDEVAYDDNDYMLSPVSPTSTQSAEVALTDIADPLSDAGHVVRFRIAKDAAAGAQLNFRGDLVQGTTVIATALYTNVPATPVDVTLSPSELEIDAITDYSDLRLRATFEQV